MFSFQVVFCYVGRSENNVVDLLAKQGVDRVELFVGPLVYIFCFIDVLLLFME